MLGKLVKLPDQDEDGAIKLFIGASFTLLDVKSESDPLEKKLSTVKFDLNIYFDTDATFEAINVTVSLKLFKMMFRVYI